MAARRTPPRGPRPAPEPTVAGAASLLAGRYRYDGELGRGASSRVIGLLDASGEQLVAKLLAPAAGARALWELDALSSVSSPHLARVVELLRPDAALPAPLSIPRHAWALIETRAVGEPSAEAIVSADGDARRAERLGHAAVGVARALAALHDRGLTHGDVKPDNVLLSGDHATLVDLGGAAPFGRSDTITGTLAFMAPEAREGERSPATDLYSLGATILAWASGGPPDPGDVVEVPAWVPAPIAQLARELVSLRIAERPRDAHEVLDRLEHPDRSWKARRRTTARAPVVGASDAVARLMSLLDQGSLVAVVGPPGSGRTRLVEEAARELQGREARAGRSVPTYWRGSSLPWSLESAAIVHLEGAELRATGTEHDLTERAELERFLRASRIASIAHRVVLERATEIDDVPVVRALPLSDGELRELVLALTGEAPGPAAIAAAREATHGLAGRLVRSVDALTRSGRDPQRASDWREAAWIGRDEVPRPAGAQALVELASALGGQLTLSSRWSDEKLADGARWALREGLASLAADGALTLRDDVVVTLDRETRRRLVRSAVELGLVGLPRAIAESLSGRDAEGTRAALAMAAEARDEGSPETARALLRRYLAYAAPAEASRRLLTRELSDALRAEGELEQALEALRGGPRDAVADPETLLLEAEILRLAGRAEDTERTLDLVLRADASDVGHRARAEALRARARLSTDRPEAAAELADSIDRRASPLAASRAAEVLALVALSRSDAREALARAREGMRDADSVTRQPTRQAALARLSSLEGQALAALGRLRDARDAHASSAALARAAGERLLEATFQVNAGLASLDEGALGAALVALEHGARLLARLGRPRELGRALANLANATGLVGDDARARALADEAARACREAGDLDGEALVAIVKSELAVQQGKLRSAAALLEACAGDTSLSAIVAARLCAARALLGDRAAAERALGSSRPEGPRAEAEHDLAEVRLALASRELERAEAGLERVRALAESHAVGFELQSRALALRVELEEARGRRTEARSVLGRLRALLEPTLRALPPELQSRFRQIPSHRRALSEGISEGALAHSRDATPRPRDAALAGLAALAREPRLSRLLDTLAEVALDVSAAERAFVVEWSAEGPRVRARAGAARADVSARPSSAIVARALRERVVVSSDAVLEHDASSSVHALALRSVLAVHLAPGPGARAPFVVVVDDRLRQGAFDAPVTEALRAVADVAGPLLGARLEARRARRGERDASRREQSLEEEARRQRETLRSLGAGEDAFAGFVHESSATARLVDDARRLAASSLPILLVGESGVGKDSLARALHRASERRHAPFVAETGAALSGELLESTLFGHVRGAFTGADRARKGLFELAHGGTLFLDGVEGLPLEVQAKLLRVLVEGQIRPLGSERPRAVDVRVLAAMRTTPEAAIASGALREDLYYRLAGATLVVPPLRERPEDLDAIASRTLATSGRDARLTPRARDALHAYSWPGNVRELEHELRRALLVAEGRTIDLPHLAITQRPGSATVLDEAGPSQGSGLHARRGELTRELVLSALDAHHGNRTHTARALGISRFGLQKILRRLSDG